MHKSLNSYLYNRNQLHHLCRHHNQLLKGQYKLHMQDGKHHKYNLHNFQKILLNNFEHKHCFIKIHTIHYSGNKLYSLLKFNHMLSSLNHRPYIYEKLHFHIDHLNITLHIMSYQKKDNKLWLNEFDKYNNSYYHY